MIYSVIRSIPNDPPDIIATHVVGDNLVTGSYDYNPRDWVTEIDYTSVFRDSLVYDYVGNVTRWMRLRVSGQTPQGVYTTETVVRLLSLRPDVLREPDIFGLAP